jgi:hypothetical protein
VTRLYHTGKVSGKTMTTKLISQQAPTNPTQNLLHTLEKFIKFYQPNVDFFLAGGAVLKAYNQEQLTTSDLDIFFTNNEDFNKVSELLQQYGDGPTHHQNCLMFKMHHYGDSVFTKEQITNANVCGKQDGAIKMRNHVPVQAIKGTFWKTPEYLLEHFDFTICQMIYRRGSYIMTQEAYEDNQNKIIRFSEQADMRKFKHRRLLKYCKRGYTPDIDTFKRLFLDTDALHQGDFLANDSSDDYDL